MYFLNEPGEELGLMNGQLGQNLPVLFNPFPIRFEVGLVGLPLVTSDSLSLFRI